MMLGCGCGVKALAGLYGTEMGGQDVTSTGVPVGTLILNSSGNVVGTTNAVGGVSSFTPPVPTVSNTGVPTCASGAIPCLIGTQTVCVPPSQCLGAQSQWMVPEGGFADVITTQPSAAPQQQQTAGTGAAQAPASTTPPASSDIMLGTFDLSTFWSNYWMYVVGGAGALVLLTMIKK